jgi:hypothetical protein
MAVMGEGDPAWPLDDCVVAACFASPNTPQPGIVGGNIGRTHRAVVAIGATAVMVIRLT